MQAESPAESTVPTDDDLAFAGVARLSELLAAGEPLGMPVLEKITSPDGLEDAEARGFMQVGQDGRRTPRALITPLDYIALTGAGIIQARPLFKSATTPVF